MSLYEIVFGGSGVLVLLLTLIELMPIKINPWSKLAENIGKAFNKPALDKITSVEQQLKKTNEKLAETNEKLDGHMANDELQKAEDARAAPSSQCGGEP